MNRIIGIYKITNKINGKIYIGQSKNIYSRWKRHIYYAKQCKYPIQKAIIKYGKENFEFAIICECEEEELNEKEMYYIKLFNSDDRKIGYNLTIGGNTFSYTGKSRNYKAKLSDSQVYDIRKRYGNRENKYEIYEDYKDIISFNTFCDIWVGKTYRNILLDVYSEDNKKFHKNDRRNKEYKFLTPKEEILNIRQVRNEGRLSRKEAYLLFQYINKNTFNDIWYDKTYKNIQPVIKNNHIKYTKKIDQDGVNNPTSKYSEEEVRFIRRVRDMGYKPMETYKKYEFNKNSCFESFLRIWKDKSYNNVSA